ncbi:PREDICTED: gamma-glutamyl hydrolase-like [Calidris pugnax]|nr:PREDICTED: gamma-glutamyl hydrolase-like [Calidris pugnax]XP_014795093.1 PREDICTED: gamma-glutamyl hydrolase-like [Calidris pugnax]
MGRLVGLSLFAAAAVLLLLLRGAVAASLRSGSAERNDRPIIGVLSQEWRFEKFYKFGSSYIAASYVKFLESAGARVVPIRLNLTDEVYDKIFHSING